jgi:hypothetical protein
MSESRDRRLSPGEWLGLRWHILMCRMCKIYGHKISSLSRICHEAGERAEDCCPGELSAEKKERIRKALADDAPTQP